MSDFAVEYSQGATGPGRITFTINGVRQTLDASGRLGRIGSRVVSPTFNTAEVDAVIECVRTSTTAMRVIVNIASDSDVQQSDHELPYLEQVIEDVPLAHN